MRIPRDKKAFTLLELIIAVVVVGILATLGLVNYTKVRERSLAKEARANLKLIAAAERVYRMEYGHYYQSSAVNDINNNLRLGLSTTNWNYAVTSAANNQFNATATGTGSLAACTYVMTQDNTGEPLPEVVANCPTQ